MPTGAACAAFATPPSEEPMSIVTSLRCLLTLTVAALPLVAQSLPGTEVPAPKWRQWLQGEQVVIGGEPAPACTVFTFCTRRPAAFLDEADYVRGLQQRFADRGLTVVAVLAEAPEDRAEMAKAWAGCRVAVDDADATSAAWLGPPSVSWNTIVLDRRGVVAFAGRPESGLVDAIEQTLNGTHKLDLERMAFSRRLESLVGFDDSTGGNLAKQLAGLIGHSPRDGVAHGLAYMTQVTKLLDLAAAKKVRTAALAALQGEPRPLAAFADLALRCDPKGEGLARELLEPLAAAAAAVPGDPFVQLAHLRALVLAGEDREVGRRAMRMQKIMLRSADSCLDFASVLAGDSNALVHRDLAQRVLDQAEKLGATPRFLTAARYGAAVRCQEDPAAAKQLMDAYLVANEEHGTINNDCWYLMTELPTMGRYDWFAAGLAERMLEQRDTMQNYEFDTAALAMFLVGRVAEAIELQEKAIAMGGASADYTQRLRRYQAAAATPPK
jgi:hypothetical protein